jgi:D-glycero-D-manno-heptose 1,7-bisphosphate phosphatase
LGVARRRVALADRFADISMSTNGRAAVFLDRDGVLNELVPDPVSGMPESPLRAQDVRLASGAAAAAAHLQRLGFLLVCVSNQPAAAKGKVSPAELRAEGVKLAASHICMHHEQGVVRELTGPCQCRKPAPGMLLDAASALGIDLGRSWMVGDTDADVAAGRAAGCTTLLVTYPGSAHKRLQGVSADLSAQSLAEAAQRLASGM